jgi:hypothetical protein
MVGLSGLNGELILLIATRGRDLCFICSLLAHFELRKRLQFVLRVRQIARVLS